MCSLGGEHEAVIDPALWEALQERLVENAVERGTGTRVQNPSLLVGLLFDSEGHRMTPTRAVKNGRRYRYYVSRPLIVEAQPDAAGLRIPAAHIEHVGGGAKSPNSLSPKVRAIVAAPLSFTRRHWRARQRSTK